MTGLLGAPLEARQTDELLVSAFSSSSFTRFDATSGAFELAYGPSGLAGTLGACVGPDGLVYVCSETTDEVLRFRPEDGSLVDAWIRDDPATPNDETGGLDGPSSIVFGPSGAAYVASFATDAVLEYDGRSGAFLRVFVQPQDGNLNGPDAGMAFGPGGDLYVPSFWNDRVKRYDAATGAFVENFLKPTPSGLRRPRTVLFPGDSFVYCTSEGSDEVLRFDAATGDFVDRLVWDDPATANDETGGLDGPTGMRLGPDGRLYVASVENNRVLAYDFPSGAFAGEHVAAGAGGLVAPTFLLFRPRTRRICDASPNSAGAGAYLVAHGFTSVAAAELRLDLNFAPPNQSAIAFFGPQSAQQPLGDGVRCVGGTLVRMPSATTDTLGGARFALDFGSPPAQHWTAGSRWYFQAWYRDPAAAGSGSNLSDAIELTFGP